MTTPPGRQLARLLDAPHLERLVPGLAPETLHQIVRHYGLGASVDLVALTTPAQLTAMLDLDLWGHDQGGREERFDAARFGEWIEALTDVDAALAARSIAALDVPLVVAGLSAFIRVSDPAAVAPYTTLDGEQIGAEPDDAPGAAAAPATMTGAVGGYHLDAIRADTWDAIVSLLIALDAEHAARFHDVMRGLRALSYSRPEVDGLDRLLLAPEQAMLDLATSREVRRAHQGYVPVDEARAFLASARTRSREEHEDVDTRARHPIIREYTSSATDDADDDDRPVELPAKALPAASATAVPDAPLMPATDEAHDALADVLVDVGVPANRPLALLEGPRGSNAPGTHGGTLVHIRALLDHLSRTDHAGYEARTRELAFLANALLAGCTFQDRAFTPTEASSAAAAVCNLGLERAAQRSASARDLIAAFEVGWSGLYEDVVLFTTDRLIDLLRGVHSGDTDTHRSITDLRKRLVKHRATGTPWRGREALDVLAVHDVAAWKGILGLIDECPMMPAVIDATLDRRTGTISATDYAFIETTVQIERAQAFVARVPELLAG